MKFVKVMGLVVFLLLILNSASQAEVYVGRITDGYQKDCIVQSKGITRICEKGMHLFPGDVITKEPAIEKLKAHMWKPYADLSKRDKVSAIVVCNIPEQSKVTTFLKFIGFSKEEHNEYTGATRGGLSKTISPNDNATVISNKKISFTLTEGDKYLVFKDSKGKEILKDVSEKLSIRLTPEEVGMKESEVYTWRVTGSGGSRHFRIRLLDNAIAKRVETELKQIDDDKSITINSDLKKAAYLKFISDDNPQEIDLYWLCNEHVRASQNSTLSEDDMALLDELRAGYQDHVKNLQ